MIDLHNHIINQSILSKIDWDCVLETARLAVGEGIEQIVWTPEFYSINDLQNISQYRLINQNLQANLDEKGYPLHISLGADLHLSYISHSMCQRIREVIDADYVVVSFEPYLAPQNLKHQIGWLSSQKLVPIIAHPEQYNWINEKYHLLYELIDLGAWIQITSDSLLGMFGKQAEYWANRLLEDGIVHIVASESHSLDYKPPLMSEARIKVEKKMGKKEADNIFRNRAAALLSGQPLNSINVPPGIVCYWEGKEVIA